VSWVEIMLGTGRHHQIRVQFSHFGHAILGDLRYGGKKPFHGSLALHARQLTIKHPTLGEEMTFEAEPEDYWPPWAREPL
jgi:23S rRNA pseudouridine1911/1915/1917 synthase